MKNKNRIIALSMSVCILVSLIIPIALPLVTFASDEVVYINNADEFIDFAKKCSYDAWSIGKTFILNADISLEGRDFEPIPSFSGIFDGQEHTVSGIRIDGAYSPAGLFSALSKDALVKNLTVKGVISPDGDKGYVGGIVGSNHGRIENCSFRGTVIGKGDVGGIAGYNRLSGSISDCTVSGEIIGENRTGGISGSNDGLISSCINKANVNTISVTPALSLDEINISLTLDISKIPSLNNSTMNDTGGITGYTTGIIIGCENRGNVGYPHIGYNVGGIVGRSCGHLANNTNIGEIFGRKDVGGIVGQIEPNVSYELSDDLLGALKAELNRLETEVNDAIEKSDGSIPNVSTRLDTILKNIDDATNSLNSIINGTGDFGDDLVGEVNRVSQIIAEVISQFSEITAEIPDLTEIFGDSLSELESALGNLESFSGISEEVLGYIADAFDNASKAFGKIEACINSINIGIGAFESALIIKDKDGAKESIELIGEELSGFVTAVDSFTAALESTTELLKDLPWSSKAFLIINDLVDVFGEISDAVSEIYDATIEIDESFDIYWSKFEEAGNGLVVSIGHFADMTRSISDAIEFIDSGFSKISEGITLLSQSVTANDQAAAKEAVKTIGIGFDQLINGGETLGASLTELSRLIDEGITGGDDPDRIMSSLSGTIADISAAVLDITNGTSILWNGISAILSDVKIDFDSIGDSASLIVGGLGDVDNSIDEIKAAVRSLSEGVTALYEAITAINDAIVIKDEDRLSSALDNAYNALGDIVKSMNTLADVFEEITNTIVIIMDWGDDFTASINRVTDAMTEMSGALVNIQSGVDSLRGNVSFDLDSAKEGLGFIRDGLDKMADASDYLKECFADISDAITAIDSGSEYLDGFVTDFKEFISKVTDGTEIITDISERLHMLIGYLKDIDPVQLPSLPESITDEANRLFIYINNIESELKALNPDITSLSQDLIKAIGNINRIFNAISNNIVDMIYGLNNGDIIDNNVSEEEIDSVTNGKIFSCINRGNVQGDINVGGIGGAMGLEYALDPEDDLSIELSVTQKKQYRLKAVIHACKNYGDITSKRDCAGGIVGKMDLGLIYGSEAYCNVESQSGNYVGGIAGITAGLISRCFAKCSLYGGKYIGGIVGSGVSEDYSGDSSMVRGCCSMVEIRRFSQYAGAISGINAGEYSENLFVSNTLAGIDRVSYLGKAEPISYEDLIKRRSIPDGFYSFTVKFMVDGKLLYSTEISYGASIDPTRFPEIPEKDGHYAYWDRTELNNLVFDTEVNAIYKPYITAIESEEKRGDDRHIFFVQGEFVEGQHLTVQNGCDTSKLTLIEKFFTKDSLIESWILTIPKDNLDVNNIHFLPKNEHCRVFIKINGSWQQVEAKEFGSYLTFDVEGEEIEIAIVEHEIKWTPIIILAGCALLVILTMFTVIIIVKKKKAKKVSTAAKEEK